MPSDIRSFFGGKGSQEAAPKAEPAKPAPKANGRSKRKIVEDSDDDDEPPAKQPTPKKSKPVKREATPEQETNASSYFGSKKSAPNSAKSTPAKAKPRSKGKNDNPGIERDIPKANGTPKGKAKAASTIVSPANPSSARGAKTNGRAKRNYADLDDEDDDDDIPIIKQNDDDSGEDIFTADFKKGKKADDYDSDGDEIATKPKSKAPPKKAATKATPKTTPKKAAPRKKKDDEPEDDQIQAIMDNIPQVRAPTPPPRDANKKFNPFANNAAREAPPPAAGTKEIPVGAENCLAGMTFVFTGILESLGREEGQNLVKKYGGKITGGPSGKTSFVVLGTDAGPKKLETIKRLGIKTINEDGLFALIKTLPAHGGSGKNAVKAEEKRQAEEAKIQEDAAQQEKELLAEKKKKAAIAKASATAPRKAEVRSEDQLWTTKYAPTALNQICGNKGMVEKLQNWLHNWQSNLKTNFKKPGKDGSGQFRTAMISGGPGIGKTTAAHLVAKLEGYDVVETNASDTRSKKLVETGLKGILDTTSLLGYFAGDGQKAEASKRRLVLIMDEVDGISAGDRGGVGAMASICKKTSIPIILICNERRLPKMKPFDHVVAEIPFKKPTTEMVKGRIMTILFREGMSKMMPQTVVNALIEGANADIRRVINMISQAKLDEEAMSYDDSQKMSNAWEKNVVLKPWDLTHKILSSQMWAAQNKNTLNDKADLYFNDHEFSYLMLQENYLHSAPHLASDCSGRKQAFKTLELFDQAASSISDGDLVDSMIHGPQQHWALMPTHAIMSFVRPASFVYGASVGQRIGFTSWLGNNSKQGKLSRYVKEIQAHMRLRTSADRHEIRQQYLPLLFNRLIRRLQIDGEDAETIDEVIDLMDSYFITREDWDYILELGVGGQDMSTVNIKPTTKSNFTRKYNAVAHPVPFMKASMAAPPAAKNKVKPDLEEAIEESDDDQNLVDPAVEDDGEEELDLKKDKYVSAPKKRKAPAASSKKGKGKKKAVTDDEDEDEEDDGPPAKKSKASAKTAKGKGKKA